MSAPRRLSTGARSEATDLAKADNSRRFVHESLPKSAEAKLRSNRSVTFKRHVVTKD